MKIKPEISMNEETLMHIADLSKGDCFIFKHSKESGWTNMIPYFDEQRNQKPPYCESRRCIHGNENQYIFASCRNNKTE